MKNKLLSLPRVMYTCLLLLGIFLLFGCLKEGSEIHRLDHFQLVVVPYATEVEVGDNVNFDIILLGEIVDADLYIDSVKISGHEHTFKEPGIYTVYAKKEGVKTSDSVEIQVRESKTKLKLIASNTQITVGDSISFTTLVLDDTVSADIYVNTIKLSDNKYVFGETGTFMAYALKDGYVASDTLEISVHSKEKLILTAASLEVKEGDTDTFHVAVDGKQVFDANIYVEDTKISDSIYRFDEAGTYNVYALKDGFTNSDTLIINVTKVQLPKLSLLVTKTKITVGEQLSLSPMYMEGNIGSRVKDAKVYVGGKLVEVTMEGGYPFIWWSDEPGTFKAYAQKEGYENSDTLEIVVQNPPPKLVVIPSDTNVTAGTNVTFSVKMMLNGREQPAPDAQIYVHDSLIMGYQYTFTTAGSYKVVAKGFGGGILDSDPVTVTVKEGSISVYISGYSVSSSTGKRFGHYWNYYKGGSLSYGLAPGLMSDANMANDIAVYNGEIYIAGALADYQREHYAAQYWKRDKSNKLSTITLLEGYAEATAVALDKDNVYMAGNKDGHPVYWKNGSLVDLAGSGSQDWFTTSGITPYENDVYISGGTQADDAPSDSKAFYWKNNASNRVSLMGDGTGALATGIAVYNEVVYVSGANMSTRGSQAAYWKNGSLVKLTSGAEDYSVAYDIKVVKGVVYACGAISESGNNYAVYWKDGHMVKLTGGTEMAEGFSIDVSPEGNVYVAGWETHDGGYGSVAKYWKVDGTGKIEVVQLLTPTVESKANGIYLEIN